MTRLPSRDRGCTGKINLGSKHYKKVRRQTCQEIRQELCGLSMPLLLRNTPDHENVDGTYAEVLIKPHRMLQTASLAGDCCNVLSVRSS